MALRDRRRSASAGVVLRMGAGVGTLALTLAALPFAQLGCGGGGDECVTSRDCASEEQCVLGACEPRDASDVDGGGPDGGSSRLDGAPDANARGDGAVDAAQDGRSSVDATGHAGEGGADDAAGPDGAIRNQMLFGPGVHELDLPAGCDEVVVQLWGGGGGGGGDRLDDEDDAAEPGDPGEPTMLGQRVAGGGGGGDPGIFESPDGGAGGTAMGGNINLPGNPGDSPGRLFDNTSGAGGDAPNGGSGGESVEEGPGNPGDPPGGGGSGAAGFLVPAAGGGSGGYVRARIREFNEEPVLVVGRGGAGGAGTVRGGDGADGRAVLMCRGDSD